MPNHSADPAAAQSAVTGEDGRPGRRHRSHRSAGGNSRRSVLRVVYALASVLSVVLLVGFGYGWYQYRSLNSGLQHLHLNNLAGASGAVSAGATKSATVSGTAQNLLLVGVDSRDGLSKAEQKLLAVGDDQSTSADSIMIIHIPANGAKASIISIPRDSYVDIPGYKSNKINASYADGYTYTSGSDKQKQAGAAQTLVATVQKLTGLSINHYVQVSFGGFYTITKAIGDLPVNLCESTNDTVAYNEAHGEGDAGSDFVMSAGKHNLTPLDVFKFVRQRHNLPGGDLDRVKRQQYFLTTAFRKIASAGTLLNPVKLDNLIKAVNGALYVDDNNFSITTLAEQMANLSATNITGYTIPTQGSAMQDGQSVIVVDPAKVKSYLNKIVTGTIKPKPTARSTAASSSATPASGGSSTAKPATGCIN